MNQLQTQANKGNKAALRELQRREKLKEEQSSEAKGSSGTADAQETAPAHEPGKGDIVDKTA